MNTAEKLLKHASFTLSERDIQALDMLAEAHCLRNRSDVVRHLVRQAARNLHKHHKKES